jgi:hypothetical protein
MDQWHFLYSTQNLPEANIIKGMLEENNVPVMLVNKQSSSYLNFGEIELYVPFLLKDVARNLVDQGLQN